MKIYFNGWFSGFIENTNPGLQVIFFIELFEKVYLQKCEIGTIENSEILCEFDMLIDSMSVTKRKEWKHTYLFTGEYKLLCNPNNYTCVLCCERNHGNIVNVPLFIPYIYTNGFMNRLENKSIITQVPDKDVCVILTNPNGIMRNKFLNELEKHVNVSYAGSYKNNVPQIHDNYNTQSFLDYVSQYKFIVTMENNRTDTYITEKVTHGLLANTIPIYWGSTRISEYINEKRILILDENMEELISRILYIKNNPTEWLNIVNQYTFPNKILERTKDIIVKDIQQVLLNLPYSCVYAVCSPVYEKEQYDRLKNMLESIHINAKYISPTYKHTITDAIINSVTHNLIKNIRHNGMKKSEISLMLNYKAILEDICKNYSDGLFLILESDVIIIPENIKKMNLFIETMKKHSFKWDLIHIGSNLVNNEYYTKPYHDNNTPYRLKNQTSKLPQNYIEDNFEEYKMFRKFHTRCTDSFLWNYTGIVKFLNYMNETSYEAPLDWYIINYLETHHNFKHYWSMDTFFIQGSNQGIFESTIQKDVS